MTVPNPAYVAPTVEQVAETLRTNVRLSLLATGALTLEQVDRWSGEIAAELATDVRNLYAPLVAEREALLDEIAGLREVIRTAESSLILAYGESCNCGGRGGFGADDQDDQDDEDDELCPNSCDHCQPDAWHGCVLPAGHGGYHSCEAA